MGIPGRHGDCLVSCEFLNLFDRRPCHCQPRAERVPVGVLDLPPIFASSDKVIELVQRGGGFTDQESRLMLDQAIILGTFHSYPSADALYYCPVPL